MAIWSNNNRACTTLWTTFFTMHQLVTSFELSGDLQMKDLTFYNPLNSSALRMQEAGIIADHLDNVFRFGRGAVYEQGIDRTIAITAIVNILIDGEKLVSDLAEVTDQCYLFWNGIHKSN